MLFEKLSLMFRNALLYNEGDTVMEEIIAEMQTVMKQELTELFATENSSNVELALAYEPFSVNKQKLREARGELKFDTTCQACVTIARGYGRNVAHTCSKAKRYTGPDLRRLKAKVVVAPELTLAHNKGPPTANDDGTPPVPPHRET